MGRSESLDDWVMKPLEVQASFVGQNVTRRLQEAIVNMVTVWDLPTIVVVRCCGPGCPWPPFFNREPPIFFIGLSSSKRNHHLFHDG